MASSTTDEPGNEEEAEHHAEAEGNYRNAAEAHHSRQVGDQDQATNGKPADPVAVSVVRADKGNVTVPVKDVVVRAEAGLYLSDHAQGESKVITICKVSQHYDQVFENDQDNNNNRGGIPAKRPEERENAGMAGVEDTLETEASDGVQQASQVPDQAQQARDDRNNNNDNRDDHPERYDPNGGAAHGEFAQPPMYSASKTRLPVRSSIWEIFAGNNDHPENRPEEPNNGDRAEAEEAMDTEAKETDEGFNQVSDENQAAREKPEDSGVISEVAVEMKGPMPLRVADAHDDAPAGIESDDHDDDVEIISNTMPPHPRQAATPAASFIGDDIKIISSTMLPPPRPSATPCASFNASPACPFCEMAFSNENDFRVHLEWELSVYREKSVCPQCAAKCSKPAIMIHHFYAAHAGLKKMVCDVKDCVEAFWTADELRRHMARPHGSHEPANVKPKARLP